MAVEAIPFNSSMQIVYDIGEDEEGKMITRRRTFTNVKVDAADEDLFEIAVAFQGLQEHAIAGIYVLDKTSLEQGI